MYAWFGPYFVNGLVWTPIAVVWPIIRWGETTMLRFLSIFAQMTLAAAFIGYWANVAAMYYAFYREPVLSESIWAADTSEADPYFYGYIALSVVNSIISILFASDVVEFYRKAKEADDFKQAIQEAANEAAEEAEVGFIALF